jgi:hypothetical protein
MSQQVTLQGRTLRAGGAAYAVKWYRYAPSGELRKSIAALVERGRPHRGFIWPTSGPRVAGSSPR